MENEEGSTSKSSTTRTVEQWAEQKQMLPKMLVRNARVGRREATTQVVNPRYGEFAAAKAMHAWPEGRELTEAEFDEAIEATKKIEVR
jgi:hypothetical protein